MPQNILILPSLPPQDDTNAVTDLYYIKDLWHITNTTNNIITVCIESSEIDNP